jgi:hypothetical protein
LLVEAVVGVVDALYTGAVAGSNPAAPTSIDAGQSIIFLIIAQVVPDLRQIAFAAGESSGSYRGGRDLPMSG